MDQKEQMQAVTGYVEEDDIVVRALVVVDVLEPASGERVLKVLALNGEQVWDKIGMLETASAKIRKQV